MKRVKGTKAYQYKVVKYRPSSWAAVATGFIALLLLLVQGAYWWGLSKGTAEQAQALRELSSSRKELKSVQGSAEEIRQQLVNFQLGSEVDKSALEVVRNEVIQLKENMAQLEEENQFYRNLMAPSDNQRGLTIGAFEISQTDAPRTYRYKAVMQQLATQHNVLNGTLTFNVIGRMDGVLKVFSLNELTNDRESAKIKLRFKYFQNIEGELVLPAGFEPERIELEARSTGSKAVTVEKRFGWLVVEPL